MTISRHVELSWKLIEAKILYYSPGILSRGFVEANMPSDAAYDAMEKEYLGLCRELSRPNTVVHDVDPALGPGMMEVDWTRGSVLCAFQKLFSRDRVTGEIGEETDGCKKTDR